MPRALAHPSPFGPAVSSLLLVAASAACGSKPEPGSRPRELRVMTFNVEYGGTGVDFQKVIEAAELADADVIGLEEPYGNAGQLAEALGFPYVSRRTDVISKYPLIDPPGADGRYVWIELEPGQAAAIANVHLPSDPYGPYFTARCPAQSILQLERELRLPAIQPLLDTLGPLAAQGLPAFIVGDFNAPSHRDWTAASVGERPQITYPLRWPVSDAVEAAGFVDSYRAVHPDPSAVPGLTWWAARPNIEDEFPASDPRDRIDLVYSGGPARATASQVVGEPGARDVELSVDPWPSDHRAVVSSFVLKPAPVPVYVSVEERRVAIGDDVVVRFHGRGRPGESVSLRATAAPSQAKPARRVATADAPAAGWLRLSSAGLEPGEYQLVLSSRHGEVLSSARVWLMAPDAATALSVDASSYAPGQPIAVEWKNAPGNRWDWVAVYRAPADPLSDDYLVWSYVNSRVEGRLVLDGSAQGAEAWPLEPGDYEALLLLYDAYDVAARVPFSVAPGPLPAPPIEPAPPAWDADCATPDAPSGSFVGG